MGTLTIRLEKLEHRWPKDFLAHLTDEELQAEITADRLSAGSPK